MEFRLLHSIREGGILTITLDSPPMNLLGQQLRDELRQALATAVATPGLRCVIITGAGRAFSAGADLQEEGRLESPAEIEGFYEDFGGTMLAVHRFPVPVIAAVNGFCMGGGLELALACDFRYAAAGAQFAAPGVRVGLIASSYILPRLVGEGHARELLYTARTIDAAAAERIGLVNRVVGAADLLPVVQAVAAEIAARAPLSVQETKAVVSRGLDAGRAAWEEADRAAYLRLGGSADHREAVRAFLEKRPPRFEER